MSDSGTPGPLLIVRHTGQVFPLTHARISIGRGSDNAIVLSDPAVSQYHAAVFWQAGRYIVQDVGSTNGTYVNERRISRPQPLRHGHVLRVGDTVFNVQIPPEAESGFREMEPSLPLSTQPPSTRSSRRPAPALIIGLLLGAFLALCLITALVLFVLDQRRGEPNVTIQSPQEGALLTVGQEILLQATATGARNITRLDLSVDGVVVGSAKSTDAAGVPSLTASQLWVFEQAGPHVISAVAHTAQDRVSDPVSRQVNVGEPTGRTTPTPTASMTPLPTSTPPTDTPTPTSTLTPTDTPTPSPTPTQFPPPAIEFFRADPDTVNTGDCTTLEWGQVSNAVAATIDHGIGGVGAPGSLQVCPAETTTYVMTASGPGGVAKASAPVAVRVLRPDLVVESISFTPNPPVQSQDTEVRVLIRNIGTGAAGAFDWQWQPGTAAPLGGQVAGGLRAGETAVLAVVWRPSAWYTDLATIAQADVSNAVAESNENNNQLQVNVEVVQAGQTTVTLVSQPELDGYLAGGQAAYPMDEIRVGNAPTPSGEAVYRGFLSFSLPGIPAGATIQSAQVRFFQAAIQGDPYRKLGQLLLTHVDYGPTLDVADFDGAELGSQALAGVTSAGAWYTLSGEPLITWIGQDVAAGRPRLQLRLQFSVESDADSTPDYVQVESSDQSLGTGNVPQLIITYTP